MKTICLMLLILSAGLALAQDDSSGRMESFEKTLTAGGVKDMCVSRRLYDAGRCTGTIDGAMTAMVRFNDIVLDGTNIHVEYQKHITRGQALRVFIAFVGKHPEVENRAWFAVFRQSLQDSGLATLSTK